MLVLAVLAGGASVAIGRSIIQSRFAANSRVAQIVAPRAPEFKTIVVAAKPLRYGAELSTGGLREIPWSGDDLPPGAFPTVKALLAGGKRVVLSALEPNEPVLAGKITGSGQRGTLSNLLDEDMGAVTVPVNEVVGVGGFVLPGDRVDVFLSRQPRLGENGGQPQQAFSDVVLQNARVLAVGQLADDKTDKPSIVNAVTLEANQTDGQKLALAASVGSLSLMLRKSGDTSERPSRRLSSSDLGRQTNNADAAVTIRVTRGTQRAEYSVPGGGPPLASGSRVASAP